MRLSQDKERRTHIDVKRFSWKRLIFWVSFRQPTVQNRQSGYCWSVSTRVGGGRAIPGTDITVKQTSESCIDRGLTIRCPHGGARQNHCPWRRSTTVTIPRWLLNQFPKNVLSVRQKSLLESDVEIETLPAHHSKNPNISGSVRSLISSFHSANRGNYTKLLAWVMRQSVWLERLRADCVLTQ